MECTMKESSLKPRAASTAMPQLQHGGWGKRRRCGQVSGQCRRPEIKSPAQPTCVGGREGQLRLMASKARLTCC